MAIDVKTTAFIIDELITTYLKKYLAGKNVEERIEELEKVVKDRTGTLDFVREIIHLVIADTLCWIAQEDIMNEKLKINDRLQAAVNAQQYNAMRNKHMRGLEKLQNQSVTGQLEKTYHNGEFE